MMGRDHKQGWGGGFRFICHVHPNKLPIYDRLFGVSLMNKDKFGHL